MKRIGLVGGMSWTSTLDYYRLINEGINQRLGGLHAADCVVDVCSEAMRKFKLGSLVDDVV